MIDLPFPKMLAFEPQDVLAMRGRFADSLIPTYTIPSVRTMFANDLPGSQRRHVFDFATGLRLIVSVDVCPLDRVARLHVSGGLQAGTEFSAHAATLDCFDGPDWLGHETFKAFSLLCDLTFHDLILCFRWNGPVVTQRAIHYYGPERKTFESVLLAHAALVEASHA